VKIGLIDADGHNFPNLPLMKLSTCHKNQGDEVEFCTPLLEYDIVYISKVFDFTPDIETVINAKKIIKGGTGYSSGNFEELPPCDDLPINIEHIMPDYSLYPQYDEAYGFVTRGCPRNCPFCIVTQKEGKVSRKVADIDEFWAGQKTIKLLDPNLLACADRERILQQLADIGAWVDFTQGLDIRLIDKEVIQLLNKIKIKVARFAWDDPKEDLTAKFQFFRENFRFKSHERKSVYVLTNFNSSLEEDLHRVYSLRDMGYDPYIMIYDKNSASEKTRRLQRFVNNRRIFRTVKSFEEYDHQRS